MPPNVKQHIDEFPYYSEEELGEAWEQVKTAWRNSLERYGVRLPTAGSAPSLWLSILWIHKDDEPIHKRAIGKVVTNVRSDLTDDQQVRHLKGAGWHDVGGGRGWHKIDFSTPSPDWLLRQTRRGTNLASATWEEIKLAYDNKCAWCRAEEGTPHWMNSQEVRLQQGHKDPARPAIKDNIIPLCQYHNQALRDSLVLDQHGFPKAVASTALVAAASRSVKLAIRSMLANDPDLK